MKCEFEHEEYGILCAAFEFDIEEWLEITEAYKTFLDGFIIERTVVCIHCGQTDIDYPV